MQREGIVSYRAHIPGKAGAIPASCNHNATVQGTSGAHISGMMGALPIVATSPVSLTDRTIGFGPIDMGAIPVWGTNLIIYALKALWRCTGFVNPRAQFNPEWELQ